MVKFFLFIESAKCDVVLNRVRNDEGILFNVANFRFRIQLNISLRPKNIILTKYWIEKSCLTWAYWSNNSYKLPSLYLKIHIVQNHIKSIALLGHILLQWDDNWLVTFMPFINFKLLFIIFLFLLSKPLSPWNICMAKLNFIISIKLMRLLFKIPLIFKLYKLTPIL